MPIEWLHILQEEHPQCTYVELQNMTVKQVNDVLEVMEMRRMYDIERERIKRSMESNGR